ncbi:AAA family ATPase [Eubacteriaceae bacterium ES3]|nr:AAA family ATPase [Eubacteriaceae bacterium ES3]
MEAIKYKLKSDYIMEDTELMELIKDTAEKHQVILLVAPQGTGKSYYFQNIETPSIIISPTRALTNQYFSASIKDKYGDTKALPNTFFQSVEHIQENANDVDFLVIDEIHKAVQYSSFAYQQTDNIIKAFDEFKKSGKPIILTTATPDILKCLEGFPIYDDICARIEIITDKEYVKEVRVMEGYAESKVEDLIKERYNSDNDSMQVVLINNTKRVEKLAEKLNNTGIKSIGISSQNRDPCSDEERIFKELTKNNQIDYNVLIATSWVDVGINFVNENITDIYCMFDDEYRRGDFTLLWQFMARARNVKPVFYITRPVLTEYEEGLINNAASHFSLTNEDVKEEFMRMYNDGIESKVYSYLYKHFCDMAQYLIEQYYDRFIIKETLESVTGIYFGQYQPDIAKFSPIPVRYLLYKILEKVSLELSIIVQSKPARNYPSPYGITSPHRREQPSQF